MKKLLVAFIIICFGNDVFAQGKIKFSPELKFGFSARNASIELMSYQYIRNPPISRNKYNQIKLTRNKNLIVELQQSFWKPNLTAQLSGALRYGHVYYDSNQVEVKSMKYDLFLDVIYLFKKKKNMNKPDRIYLFAGAGFGQMNYNTKFKYKHTEYDFNNNPIERERTGSFMFLAPRVTIGALYKKLQGSFVVHGTPDDTYEPNPTIWMEFKLTYSLMKL